ncbi:MAG TPA: hypothetical protein VD993_20415 [Chitinophagaceae bacterium]|nr:hypothetical protein [Chitinophagaceae bacterium]
MFRAFLILAIAGMVLLSGCYISIPVYIRNFTNDTLALVIEPKNRDYFEFLSTEWWPDSKMPDSNALGVFVTQANTLVADNRFAGQHIMNKVVNYGDSSCVIILLPPHSTTKAYSFPLAGTSTVRAYVQFQDNTKKHLLRDIPLLRYNARGKLSKHGTFVFDIR